MQIGIILIIVTILCWGFGDFFIQKSTRKMGDWESLFIITAFGFVILSPLVLSDIWEIFVDFRSLLILLVGGLIMFIAALIDFEALKKGKLAIIEPVWSTEIIVSVLLALFILGETTGILQIILILTLMIGLVLVSLKSEHFHGKNWIEKGVLLALLAALLMGVANFFLGWGSRETDALVANWVFNFVMAFGSLVYLIYNKRIRKLGRDIFRNKKLTLSMIVLDNTAWIAFAFAMTFSNIGIVVALTESYIVIAVLLGVFVNKEYLRMHQKIGVAIAVASAIALSFFIG